jgi:hypothetical protein
MEPEADSREVPEEDLPEHDPADSLACSRLRARLRLEQRLLRPEDGIDFGRLNCRLRL